MKERRNNRISIAVVIGTRPDIIKLSPVIKALAKRKIPFYVIHTGQHYSYYMDKSFLETLRLPRPKHHLLVGSGTHSQQTAEIMRRAERILVTDRPRIVVVQGDTNTTLGVALACSKLDGIGLWHVEAGLRSYDRNMPEEINRILTDHAADMLLAPTATSRRILRSEGIPASRIKVTGNTIVDSVRENLPIARRKSEILSHLSLERNSFFLMTLHRQENVTDKYRFSGIIKAVSSLADDLRTEILYPAHPRSLQNFKKFGIRLSRRLRVVEPLGYFDFLVLMEAARLILSDSGGVQEEACILRIPCVTLRHNTERPETVEVGANIIGGTGYGAIRKAVDVMLSRNANWPNPFGDGKAGERIARLAEDVIRRCKPDG